MKSADGGSSPSELLQQIDTSRQMLDEQLASLRQADGSHMRLDVLAQGGAKLLQLNALRHQLAGGAKDVAVLRAEIASAVADIRAYMSDARSAANAVQNGAGETSAQSLQQASEASERATAGFMDDYYHKRIFDPYLRFASTQDEEDYRRHEQEREQAINAARAEHTPQGDLRANTLAIEQLKDAGAHGATASPRYKPELDALLHAHDNIEKAVSKQDGQRREADAAAPDAPGSSQNIDPALLASLKNAKISMPDQSATGHGVNFSVPNSGNALTGPS